jgi:hypothetical protein
MIYSEIQLSYNYKEKRLFGGRENSASLKVDQLDGIGFLFLNFDAGVQNIPLSQRSTLHLSAGLRKAVIIPWKIGNTTSSGGNNSGEGIPENSINSDLIKTIFLSGLSVYAKISM